jgi:hypothetical protein
MVNPISAFTLPISLLMNALQSVGRGSDSDGDGRGVQAAGGESPEKQRFLDAILQVLSQAGVTGINDQAAGAATSSSNSSPSTTQDPVQALGGFVDALFAALQAQSVQGMAPGGASSTMQQGSDFGDSGVRGPQGMSANEGRQFGGGSAGTEARLQSLVQQLSSGLSPSGGSQTVLEQSFANLLSSLGDSRSRASIGTFLQALSQNLRGESPAGNVVNTLA